MSSTFNPPGVAFCDEVGHEISREGQRTEEVPPGQCEDSGLPRVERRKG